MNTKTKFSKQILSILLCLAMLMSYVPMTAYAAAAATPTIDQSGSVPHYRANGTPLYIEAGTSSGTAIYYMNGSQKVYMNASGAAGDDLSNVIVWGGYTHNALDGDATITMTGGSITCITGGGYDPDNLSGGYVKNVNISISGGTVSEGIYAGWMNPVNGNVNITMTGGSVGEISCCCDSSTAQTGTSATKVSGNVNLRITGGSVGKVYSGDGYCPITGTVSALIMVPVELCHYGLSTDKTYYFDNLLYINGSTWVQKGDVTINSGETLTIAEGQKLTLNGSLTNNGTIVNNGTVDMSSAWTNNGSFINNGTLNKKYPIYGNAIVNNGTVNYYAAYVDGITSVGSISAKMDGTAYTLSQEMYEVVDGRLYVWLPSGNAEVTVNGSKYYGITTAGKQTALTAYVGVSGVTGIPSQIAANRNYTLSASLLPETSIIFAQTISYELVSSTAPGTTLADGVLYAAGAGTAKVKITATDTYVTYSTTVDIQIVFTPVTGLAGTVSSELSIGTYTLPGVIPTDASYTAAVWSVVDAGTTEATISGNTLTINKQGTLKIKVTVENGLAYGTAYTQEFTITAKIVTGSYVNRYWDSTNKKVVSSNATIDSANVVTSGNTSWTSGWYIVTSDTTISDRITVSGTVNLILCDGCTLTASGGVSVNSGNTLSIYGQTMGTGTLNATNSSSNENHAAVGGDNKTACGTICINGGTVSATGSSGAGIGGGYFQAGGTITINGGVVSAKGSGGAAIGSGSRSEGKTIGKVTINGGTVSATTGSYGAGIGGGYYAAGYTVVINGGNVRASSKNGSAIGAGYLGDSSGNGTLKNADGNTVSLNTFTLNGAAADTAVTEVEDLTYGLTDVKTLDTDKLYFYLASDTSTAATAGGEDYICKRGTTFYTSHDVSGTTCVTTATCSCGATIPVDPGNHEKDTYTDGFRDCCGAYQPATDSDSDGYYEIYNAGQLFWFAQKVNNGEKSIKAILMDDIDLNNKDWTIICETGLYYNAYGSDYGYSGTFDGNFHVIKNLKVTSSATMDASCGLFGTVSGTIKNLGIEGFTFVDGGMDIRAGAVAGQVITENGLIENCYVVDATINPGAHVTGGIAGCVYDGSIKNCHVYNSTITGSSSRYGYVVGDSRGDKSTTDRPGTVANCYTDGSIAYSSRTGNVTNCSVMTDAQFKSGEVTYKLNGSTSEGNLIWRQTIGTYSYPKFTGDVVYHNGNNVYSNTPHTHNWEYKLDETTITATCTADDCTAKNGGSVKLVAKDGYYTGISVGASVEGAFTNGATYKVTYNGSEIAPSDVGTHTATLTVYENGTEKASVSAEYKISYLEAPATAYDIKGGYKNGTAYYFKDGVSVAVNAPADYEISKTLGDGYGSSVNFSESENKVVYLKRTSDGAMTNAITISETMVFDGDGATGKITITNRGFWEKLLNKITFGLFFKGDVVATVTATDNGSGVASIEYYIADTDLIAGSDDASALENVGWTAYSNEIALNKNAKNVVYIKITDNVGNVTYLNSEGIVLYSDAQTVTESVSTTYKVGTDKEVTVKLNGNTVKEIKNGTTVVSSDNYTVSADGTISLKGNYLDTLNAGTYTFTVSYNPLGMTFVDGDAPATTTFEVTVDKAVINGVTAPTAISGLTYNGNAQSLINAGSAQGGALQYSLDGVAYSANIPNATAAGEYTVYYKVVGDCNHNDAAAQSVTVTIAKAPVTIVGTDRAIAYDGKEVDVRQLFSIDENAGYADFNIIDLTGDGSFTTANYLYRIDEIGTFTVKVVTAETANYQSGSATAVLTVNKGEATFTAPTANDVHYTGQQQELVTAGTVVGGKMVFSFDKEGGYSETLSAKNAGPYTVWYKVIGDTNHNDSVPASITAEIKKATYDMSSAKWDYTDAFQYDGLEHSVQVVGLPDGVTVSGYEGNTATVVGDYTAEVTFVYDADNYNAPSVADLNWKVENNWTPSEYAVNGDGWMNSDFVIIANDGYKVSLTNTADGEWSDTLTGAVEGENSSITFYVKNETTGAISLAKTVSYKLDKNTEATGTTGKVCFDERNGWESFLNTITFGLFYKDEVTVKVEATDKLSGVAKIEYFAAGKAMTFEEVKAITTWTAYENGVAVTVEDAKQFVYFVRITDNAGNVTYLSTDGAEYDTTAPAISGIENGKTYYTTQKVTVTDKNIESITLNGEAAAESITLEGNKEATYTIVATDKAGNTTTVTVTMKPIADVDTTIDGITDDDVTSDDKETVQDVIDEIDELLKDEDLTDDEKAALEEIKDNAEKLIDKIEEADAADETENIKKVEDVTAENVTPEDKTDLENAKADLEKALEENSGNYTDEEKKAIEDELERIEDALEIIENVENVEELIDKLPENITKDDEAAIKAADDAYNALTDYEKSLVDDDAKKALDDAKAALAELNKPADSTSPNTGDNSNLWLWFALLFVSGTGIFAITVYDRKRKAVSK